MTYWETIGLACISITMLSVAIFLIYLVLSSVFGRKLRNVKIGNPLTGQKRR
jgi:hypothetical protein